MEHNVCGSMLWLRFDFREFIFLILLFWQFLKRKEKKNPRSFYALIIYMFLFFLHLNV